MLEINPMAFKKKYKKIPDKKFFLHSRGCFCKNSKCVKGYCECFSGGVGCSVLCKCVDCRNKKEVIDLRLKIEIQDVVKRKKRKGKSSFEQITARYSKITRKVRSDKF